MNKQSILSLKKCALSLGIAAMAAGFTACSEKDMPNGPVEEGTVTSVGTDVNVVNDPTELNKYVTNYKRPGSRGSRAVLERGEAKTFEMPNLANFTATAILDDETAYDQSGNLQVNLDNAGIFVVPEGKTFTSPSWGLTFNGNGGSVYVIVYGTLKVDKAFGLNGKPESNVYVARTGKLILGTDWNNNPLNFLGEGHRSLYIYDGAKIEGGSLDTYNGASLYVEGDLNYTGDVTWGGVYEEHLGKLYVGGDINVDGKLTTNNVDMIAQNVNAKSWNYVNDSKVYVENTIDIDGDVTINAQNVIDCQNYFVGGKFHMENNSVLKAYEHIDVAGNAEISSQGKVYTPCLYIAETFYIKNGGNQNNDQDTETKGNINVPNKIYCKNFQADASGFAIYMDGNALFQAAELFTILNKDWCIAFDNDADTPSAIVAKKFQIMEGDAAYIYGYAFLSADAFWGKPGENKQYYVEGDNYKDYNLQPTVEVTFDDVKVDSAHEACKPELTTPEPEPTNIELITSIIDHTHDTSATCVALNGSKPYFSWHKRGTSIHGCLEAGELDKANDTFALTSWMEVDDGNTEGDNNWDGNSAVSGAEENGETQGQFDYNHLIVANGKVITVGDNAKLGGFIGAITLGTDGEFGTNGELQDAFKSRQLLGKVTEKFGRSGNCVLYANGKYYIACAGGFQEYAGDIDNLFIWNQHKNPEKETGYYKANLGAYELTAGSAKHIAINPAGNKIATLELTSKGSHPDGDDYWFNDTETSIGAVLKVRDANDWLNTTEWEANIGKICPIYGKNAIAMDADGNVYVAAGKQGLLVYNNGNKVRGFSIADEVPHAGANGVAIDDNYVYVAYGVGGLYILNKSDLSFKDKYKSNAPVGYETEAAAASANYVAVDGEYIYVAYGRHGVKILKLND